MKCKVQVNSAVW